MNIDKIAEQAGALVIPRSGYTEYGCMDIDLQLFADLVEYATVKNCRDMFVVDSVSWKLLNDVLEAQKDDVDIINYNFMLEVNEAHK